MSKWLVICLLSISLPGFSSDLYRYTNDKGEQVVSTRIPAYAVKNGYEIINFKGSVLEVVAPEISEEEKLIKQAERERLAAIEENDYKLRKLYTLPTDVDKARRVSVRQFELSTTAKKNKIASYQKEFDAWQKKAANQERQAKEVDQTIVDAMADLNGRIKALEEEIVTLTSEQNELLANYTAQRARVVELYLIKKGKPWIEPEQPKVAQEANEKEEEKKSKQDQAYSK